MARLEYRSGIAGIKSKNSVYQDVTLDYIELFQFKNTKLVRGLTDRKVAEYALNTPYYSATTIAEEIKKEDEAVMRGKQLFIFTTVMLHGEFSAGITHKQPYIENNKIVGTVFQAMLLPRLSKQAIKDYVNNPNIIIPKYTRNFLDILELAPWRKYNFTKREVICLQHLMNGFSIADIAAQLDLSKRTVEFYLDNIKNKLAVSKLTEVIIKLNNESII